MWSRRRETASKMPLSRNVKFSRNKLYTEAALRKPSTATHESSSQNTAVTTAPILTGITNPSLQLFKLMATLRWMHDMCDATRAHKEEGHNQSIDQENNNM